MYPIVNSLFFFDNRCFKSYLRTGLWAFCRSSWAAQFDPVCIALALSGYSGCWLAAKTCCSRKPASIFTGNVSPWTRTGEAVYGSHHYLLYQRKGAQVYLKASRQWKSPLLHLFCRLFSNVYLWTYMSEGQNLPLTISLNSFSLFPTLYFRNQNFGIWFYITYLCLIILKLS